MICPTFTVFRNGDTKNKAVIGNKLIINRETDEAWMEAYVPYDKPSWRVTVKQIPGRRWHAEKKCWLLPVSKANIRYLQSSFGNLLQFNFDIEGSSIPEHGVPEMPQSVKVKTAVSRKVVPLLSEVQKEAVVALEEKLLLMRYRYATLKSYKSHLRAFLAAHPDLVPVEMTVEQVQRYLLKLIREKQIAESTQNQIINALKFYMEQVLGREKRYIVIERPRKPKPLPNVLSQEEIKRLFESVENIKHKCILMLIYSAGLRRSEVINLRIEDISKERKLLFIKDAKGKKDRFSLLSEKVLIYLRQYYRLYRPGYWLFEGQHGAKYSASSVQKIFHRAVERAGILSRPTVHTLRHSFATHLVEKGVNLKIVQDLLGHASSKTTEIYLHIAKEHLASVISPIDGLDI